MSIHAIASGKGGVGKTMLAITLAHALARRRRRVLLVDGDLGLANLDIQLGLAPARDLSDVLAGRIALPAAIIAHAAGFDLLPGRSGSGALAGLAPGRLEMLLEDLRALAGGYDEVLIDCGAGLAAATRRLAAWADGLLVVTNGEPTSLTDAYAVLKLHAGDGGAWPAGVIVNQAIGRREATRTHATLARACRGFLQRTPRLAGIVRADPHVADAIRHQTPLLTRHPTCLAAQDIDAVAEQMLTTAIPA